MGAYGCIPEKGERANGSSRKKVVYEFIVFLIFNEFVLKCPIPAEQVISRLAEKGFAAGYALGRDFKEMENCLLICATETKTAADLEAFAKAMGEI